MDLQRRVTAEDQWCCSRETIGLWAVLFRGVSAAQRPTSRASTRESLSSATGLTRSSCFNSYFTIRRTSTTALRLSRLFLYPFVSRSVVFLRFGLVTVLFPNRIEPQPRASPPSLHPVIDGSTRLRSIFGVDLLSNRKWDENYETIANRALRTFVFCSKHNLYSVRSRKCGVSCACLQPSLNCVN